MSDEIKDLYQQIVRVSIRESEKIVENCWRYYATYIKVLESIVDSQYQHNCRFMEERKNDGIPHSLNNADKSLNTFLSQEKKEAIKNIYSIATHKASSNPVR
jgi:hypothetical protein